MTIPKITPYTGGVANPDGSQTQTEFTQNMFDQLSYEANLSTELNNTVDGINDTAIQVDADATSASQSAAAAEAAVSGLDYQGLWPDTGGSANKGETWQTQTGGTPTGQYFTALQNTTADPISDDVNWREVVSVDSIGEYVKLEYKATVNASAVDNMIAGIPVVSKVGITCSTGRTSWIRVADSGNESDFTPLNDLDFLDYGITGSGLVEDTALVLRVFNKASQHGSTVQVPAPIANYLTGQITPPSNIKVVFSPASKWKAVDTLEQSLPDFEVLFRFTEQAKNVVFECNKSQFYMNQSAYTGEHNHIFCFMGCEDVIIKDPKCLDSGGDGLYFSEYSVTTWPKRVRVVRPYIKGSRRNASSVVDGEDIWVTDGRGVTNNGTTPNSAWHIEPEARTRRLKNINYLNCVSSGNDGYGFYMNLTRIDDSVYDVTVPISVKMTGASENDNIGVNFANFLLDNMKGTVSAEVDVTDPRGEAFREDNCVANAITRNVKINCVNPNAQGAATRDSGVLIGAYSPNLTIGGLDLEYNVNHTRNGSIGSDIRIEDNEPSANQFRDVNITHNAKGVVNYTSGRAVLAETDNFVNLEIKSNRLSDISIGEGDFDGTYFNVTPSMMAGGDIANTSNANAYVRFISGGYPLKVVKVKMTVDGGVRIYPPAGREIYPQNGPYYNTVDGYIIMTKKGESFTLELGEDNNVYILEANSNSIV